MPNLKRQGKNQLPKSGNENDTIQQNQSRKATDREAALEKIKSALSSTTTSTQATETETRSWGKNLRGEDIRHNNSVSLASTDGGDDDGEGRGLGNPAHTTMKQTLPKGNTQHKQTSHYESQAQRPCNQSFSSAEKKQQIADNLLPLNGTVDVCSSSSSSEDENEEKNVLLKDEKANIISKFGMEGGSKSQISSNSGRGGKGGSAPVRNNEMSTFEIEEASRSSHSAATTGSQQHIRSFRPHLSTTARVRRLKWWITSSNAASVDTNTVSSSGNGSPTTTTVSAAPSTTQASWSRSRKRYRWKLLGGSNSRKQALITEQQRQQSEDVTVTLTSGTVETSIASSTTGGTQLVGSCSSPSSTKDDPLYTRYLIKTLSSNLNQIIYLLIPSLLTQYIIRLIYSSKASHHYHYGHHYGLGGAHQSHHLNYQIQQQPHQTQHHYEQKQLHFHRESEPVALASSAETSDQHDDMVFILSMINHAFAFLTFIYFFLLLLLSRRGKHILCSSNTRDVFNSLENRMTLVTYILLATLFSIVIVNQVELHNCLFLTVFFTHLLYVMIPVKVPEAITIGSLLFGLNLALTLFFNINQDFQLSFPPFTGQLYILWLKPKQKHEKVLRVWKRQTFNHKM